MNMLYTDGCSYTQGHKREIFSFVWPNLLADKLQLRLWNKAHVAKSNDNIFFDFCKYKERLNPGDKVFIMWSHVERFAVSFYPQLTEKFMDCKNFAGNEEHWRRNVGTILSSNFQDHESPDRPLHVYYYEGWLAKTLIYMYEVQEWCKANGVDHYFITTDNYHQFNRVRDYEIVDYIKKLDETKIFNWPTPQWEYPSNHNPIEFKSFLVEWTLTNFVTSYCSAYAQETGEHMLAGDMKHMNKKCMALYAEDLYNWVMDPTKNMQYIIDNKLSYNAARCFSDIKFRMQTYPKGATREHWVESEMWRYIQQNAEFIYETE